MTFCIDTGGMRLCKITLILLVSLLVGSTFAPIQAKTNPSSLNSGLRALEKAETNQPQAPTATITVCASGCDYSSIQDAIKAASDGDTIDLAAETYSSLRNWRF